MVKTRFSCDLCQAEGPEHSDEGHDHFGGMIGGPMSTTPPGWLSLHVARAAKSVGTPEESAPPRLGGIGVRRRPRQRATPVLNHDTHAHLLLCLDCVGGIGDKVRAVLEKRLAESEEFMYAGESMYGIPAA
jgi:hypothetical protein